MESFLQLVSETDSTIRDRQAIRTPKEGELTAHIVLDTYLWKNDKGYEVVEAPRPPPEEKKISVKTGNPYPAKIASWSTLKAITLTPEDPITGQWLIKATVGYVGQAAPYLTRIYQRAWSEDPNPHLALARKYISSDGIMVKEEIIRVDKGGRVKAKMPGKNSKENVLRQKIGNTDAYIVQPGAPLRLSNVVPEVWITHAEAYTDATTGVTIEEHINVSFQLTCNGAVSVNDGYDPHMAKSERNHATKNPFERVMVPIQQLYKDNKAVAKKANFYVTPFLQGVSEGVTIARTPVDLRDYISSKEGEDSHPGFVVRFNAFYTKAAGALPNPKIDDRYVIEVRVKKDDDIFWRSYGIPYMEPYGMINSANSDIPLWIESDLWLKFTLEKEANHMLVDNAASVAPNLSTIRGYYIYGAAKCDVDFLRHFRERGIRVSADWVRDEFSIWESTNKHGTRIVLKPRNKCVHPVNELGATTSSVLSLGNGRHGGEDDVVTGEFHAFDGNISPLLDNDTHEFYILLGIEEKPKGGGTKGPVFDEQINKLKQDKANLFYWVYAVRKDAPMANQVPVPPPNSKSPLGKPLPVIPVGEKRDREEADPEDADEEYLESEESVNKRIAE